MDADDIKKLSSAATASTTSSFSGNTTSSDQSMTSTSQRWSVERIIEMSDILAAISPDQQSEQIKNMTQTAVSMANARGDLDTLQELGDHLSEAIERGQNQSSSREVLEPNDISLDYPESSILKFYGKRGNGLNPVKGDIVERNPLVWPYGDQDGGAGKRGLVVKGGASRVKILWAVQNMADYSPDQVKVVGRVAQLNIGDIVERGPDWRVSKLGNQDGGPGEKGIVTKFGSSGIEAYVMWNSGNQFNYRWGCAYDIQVVNSDAPREESGYGITWSFGPPPLAPILVAPSSPLLPLHTSMSIEDNPILRQTNNPSLVLCAGDFVIRNVGWSGGEVDGERGNVGEVVKFDRSAGIVSVKWPSSSIADHAYREGNFDVSLVLPNCSKKTMCKYKHQTRRVTNLQSLSVGCRLSSFICHNKNCRKQLTEAELLTSPCFLCEHCEFCYCLACYHSKPPPPKAWPIKNRFCLSQTRKILTEFMTPPTTSLSRMSSLEVEGLLSSCDGDLVSAMKMHRGDQSDDFSSPSAHSTTSSTASAFPSPVLSSSGSTPSADAFADLRLNARLGAAGAAAAEGNLERVKSLLSDGFDVDAKLRQGRTVLHIAAGHGSLSVAEHLIYEAKADVNVPDEDGDGKLMFMLQL